ncbi:hypothetical protein [Biostraticola tofi]|uniref:Uncharacterized protein n=1 Tax=Biostraticola tofi TaxID=466109 RepID=A0A4R3Z5S5_9GAMM|nr:hypothetical protein [Biostraticola tofi]TCW00439.1 hypothetical protein EDC52_101789 [Biostraticola tofi]
MSKIKRWNAVGLQGPVINGGYVAYEYYAALKDDCARLAAESAAYESFFDSMIEVAWDGDSIDGGDIEQIALSCGLIHEESYSEEKHGELNEHGTLSDVDVIYVKTKQPATDAYFAEIRAVAVEDAADELETKIKQDGNSIVRATVETVVQYLRLILSKDIRAAAKGEGVSHE